jgi:Rieske Fe-S protein
VQVFLARAPKSGCILFWVKEKQRLEEECIGTKYARDGKWLDGPPARALDELPVRIQGDMIWVSNQIIYGEVPTNYLKL